MIIDSGIVGMNADRAYSSTTQVKTASAIMKSKYADNVKLKKSSDADAVSQLLQADKDVKKQQSAAERRNAANGILSDRSRAEVGAEAGLAAIANSYESSFADISEPEDVKGHLVRLMIEAMAKALDKTAGRKTGYMGKAGSYSSQSVYSSFTSMTGFSAMRSAYGIGPGIKQGNGGASYPAVNLSVGDAVPVGGRRSGNGAGVSAWKQVTASSSFFEESETTQFQSGGVVRTADGREISFGVTMEMSRSFTARYDSLTKADYIMTDPLIINVNSNNVSVTDQKFLFDLDSDGKKESISFAGKGSGFLALDKNGDGVINDGSELFGTKSGDGFKDLAAYDSDGNGWIDEADGVFKDLKVWTKDENGRDQLLSLKDAGVGAIYLGSADTEFSLKDSKNNTNGVVRRTGIFLKENGEAGTIQHVDLAT